MSITETPVRAGAPIDPRIRARRVAVVRAEGRRRLVLLLTVLGAASLAGLAWLAVESPLLDVDHITARGTARVPPAEILAAARVTRGEALLFVNRGEITRRVEALPWVGRAHVSVSLDGTVAVSVTERSVSAWVAGASDVAPAALIDAHGRVVARTPVAPAGIPELRGARRVPAPGGSIVPARAAVVLSELPSALRAQTVALDLGGDTPRLLLAPVEGRPSAGEVRLGSMTDVPAKSAAALAVLGALRDDVGYVDVGVPEAPATGPSR